MDDGVPLGRAVLVQWALNRDPGIVECNVQATILTNGRVDRAHRSVLASLDQIAEIRPDVRSTYQLVMKDRERTVIDVSERQGRVLRTLIPGL